MVRLMRINDQRLCTPKFTILVYVYAMFNSSTIYTQFNISTIILAAIPAMLVTAAL